MYVPEIEQVKMEFDNLKKLGLIADWELPYENLLTRLNAAIFFCEPVENSKSHDGIWELLKKYKDFSFRLNDEKKLSGMMYRVTFSNEK